MSLPLSDTPYVSPATPHRRVDGFAYSPFLIWAAVLSLVVPALLVIGVADQGRSSAWTLSIVVVVWSGVRISLLLGRGEARLFLFFFWLFTYVFLGVAPTIQIRSDQPSATTPDVLPSLDYPALQTVLLGLVCFEIGAFVALLKKSGQPVIGRAPPRRGRINLLRTVSLWTVGVLMAAYYVAKMGLAVLFSSRDAADDARQALWPSLAVQSAVVNLSTYAPLVSLGALVLLRRAESRPGPRMVYLAMMATSVVVLPLVVNPFSSARYPLGTVLFALAVLLGAVKTPYRTRLTLSLTIFGLFFLFPLADAFRRPEANFARVGFFSEYAGNPDYDSIWQIANALAYWLAGKADPGNQALGVLLFFVPRSIWAAKPLDTGVLLGNYYGYTVTNLSAPLWAEAVINGGLLAVAIVFVIFGYLLTRLDYRVMAAMREGGAWFIAGAVFPVYLTIILRGSLLQATGSIVLVAVCVLAVRSRPVGTPIAQDFAPADPP